LTEIRTLVGPLDDDGLDAIARLYGRTDPKYRSPVYLRRLFVDNPFGWALHAFAYDRGDAVAHCAAIPVRARTDGGTVMSGKVEAYFVDERYRGAGLALELLVALSDEAEARGVDPLHAYVTPRVGAIFERAGYRAHATGVRPYVLVVSSHGGGAAVRALAAGQNAFASLAGAVVHAGKARVEAANGDDAALVDPGSAESAWTIAGSDSWEWFAATGFISAVELGGMRALIAHQGEGQPLHLLGRRPSRTGARAAVALLATLRCVARERSASTVRVQPWPGLGGEDELVRACRVMALTPRASLTIYVRSATAELAQPAPSPFFYATF
jgi:GNAT superfamily N-acetyltransferase